MFRKSAPLLLSLLVLLMAATPASGEIAVGCSVEWAVCNSDLVVVGRVVSGEDTVTGYRRLELAAAEALLGGAGGKVVFLDTLGLKTGAEYVLCLKQNDLRFSSPEAQAVVAGVPWRSWYALRLDADEVDALTMDLRVLSKREEALAAFRRAAAFRPERKEPPPTVNLAVPTSCDMYWKLYGGSAVYLMVPGDERLERLGRRWVKDEEITARLNGVAALRNLESRENVGLLRGLLADPGFYVVSIGGKPPKKSFVVRRAAYEVLKAWGEEVAEPTLVGKPSLPDLAGYARMARDRGLAWLAAHQEKDGSWAGRHTFAVTSFACLAFLAAEDRPFSGPRAETLTKGLRFLLASQKDGVWPNQGHTWIHGQGFATLTLSEAYGRTLLTGEKPDLDLAAVCEVVTKAVGVIAANQSTSGGWWYTPGKKSDHEGSTTVTAVQALVSAANFGVAIDETVLGRGFEYLKKCQNKDGGFDYKLGPGEKSMKEGTAADVATLALMQKFDYTVMLNAYRFLIGAGPEAISRERFPYYGHFYGAMGMLLLVEEFQPFKADIDGYIGAAFHDILEWQGTDGSWPRKGWIAGLASTPETDAYSTAFAALLLSVPERRLSITNREPPKLPVPPKSD